MEQIKSKSLLRLNHGDAVFFKKVKKASNRKAPEIGFKGHGFGILLGHVPPFQKDPTSDQLLRHMGAIGFLSFDDVADLLGDDVGAKCLAAFEEKYYGKAAQEAAPEIPPIPQEKSPILDSQGKPQPLKMAPEQIEGDNGSV